MNDFPPPPIDPDIFEKMAKQRGYRREGNPAPIRGLALAFREGRVFVLAQGACSNEWAEIFSAPSTSDDGLACASDLTVPFAVVFADHSIARSAP